MQKKIITDGNRKVLKQIKDIGMMVYQLGSDNPVHSRLEFIEKI
jgi:hypothetical protein